MTESGDRAAFLDAIRRATTAPRAHNYRPVAPLVSPVPPVSYANAPDDDARTDVFIAALTALGGHAERVQDRDEFVTTFLDTHPEFTRVVVSNDPECDGLRDLLEGRDDIEVLAFDNAATAATADLGITGARAAVALTGSLVVDSGRAGGRTASLLPPVHLALVCEESIVATPGDHWRSLNASAMPSNLVQITGPSRSADIELIITLGVHGPRELHVAVLSTDGPPTLLVE